MDTTIEKTLSTLQKTSSPITLGIEDTNHLKSPEKSSPNTLRELEILLRDSTADGKLDNQVCPFIVNLERFHAYFTHFLVAR
jgi:hypothetical protein